MRQLTALVLAFLFFATPAAAQQYLWRYRTAADCAALTDGKTTDLCYQTADQKVYKCVPSAGDCDTTGEWKEIKAKLPGNPAACSAGQYVTDISDDGTLTCGTPSAASIVDKIEFIISGNGSVIAAGASGHKVVPFAGTITKWEITSSASGSIVADVKKATYADLTFASIAGTEKPTISASTKGTDTSLSSWTTAVSAGDRLQAVVDSADITGTVVLTIYITRS